jgi:soluble lytic murein transglycosylase-like protein
MVGTVTAPLTRNTDPGTSMTPVAEARSLSGTVRRQRPLVAVVGLAALLASACATTAPRAPEAADPLYGTPRPTDTFLAAPPLGLAEPAAEAAPIMDPATIESSSLFLAREVLADRAPELDELQREGVARAVVRAEEQHGLPALLVLALIEQESHFRPKAVGPGGSLGLMQLMPRVAADLAMRHGIAWQGLRTLTDPVKNVHLGVLYLAEMRDAFGDTNLAMAAYNIGPGAVKKRLARGLSCKGPYVSGVLQRFHSLRLVFGDPTTAIGG